jgi:hypothetical protein
LRARILTQALGEEPLKPIAARVGQEPARMTQVVPLPSDVLSDMKAKSSTIGDQP